MEWWNETNCEHCSSSLQFITSIDQIINFMAYTPVTVSLTVYTTSIYPIPKHLCILCYICPSQRKCV